MIHRRTFVLAAAAATLPLAACDGGKQGPAAKPGGNFQAVDITGADYATDFALPDTDGTLRTLAEFKGKAVVLFFG